MKSTTLIGSAVALAVLAGIGYFAGAFKALGLAGPESAAAVAAAASAASAPRPPQTVSVYAAQARDVPVTVESAGTVVALDSVDIRPQITGVIADVLVKDGQFVRQGQPLFKLDDRADRANLERAKAQLARDQAGLADLDRQWKRAQDLRAQNFIAQSAADTVLANLESQRAAVAADIASVRAAEVALSYGTISAPLSGRIGAINVNRGSLVQPAAASLVMLNINQIDPIGVAFSVPESQLAAVLRAAGNAGASGRPGAGRAASGPADGRGARGGTPDVAGPGPAAARSGRDKTTSPTESGKPPASSSMAGQGKGDGKGAGGGKGGGGAAVSIVIPGGERGRNAPAAEPLQGRVVFVDNAVDTATGSIKVKAQVTNPSQALWPGQYVTVRMTMRTLNDAVVVPQAAMIIRGNERSVYVVKPDGTVELRTVQARVPSGEFVVVEGVQAGEKVVVDGKQNLRPGGAVRETPYVPGAGRRGPGAGASGAAASGVASGSPSSVATAAAVPSGTGPAGSARAASEALP